MASNSLIPVGSERGVTRSASNPFFALQQEIDRLFEGFSRLWRLSVKLRGLSIARADAEHGPQRNRQGDRDYGGVAGS